MAESGKRMSTAERCAAAWERRYPHVKQPHTYLREWYDEDAPRAAWILDAGCGPGGSINHIASAPNAVAVGLDPDEDALRANPNVSLRVVGSVHAMPFRDGAFDLITAQYVLEHVAEPQPSFKELGRVMRGGGAFVFTTTNASSYLGAAIRLIPQGVQAFVKRTFLKMDEPEVYPVYMRCNSRNKLNRLLEAAGFKTPDFIFIGGPFYFAFLYTLFRLAMFMEKLTDGRLRHHKFYIVGRARKKGKM